jgi:rhomboid family GlyGly-CTERM serine protease
MIVAGACLLFALAPESLIRYLACDRAGVDQGQIWRLWTGHITHFSPRHAVLDALMLLIVGVIAEREFGSRRIAHLLFAGAPLISIAMLIASPDLTQYRGASAIAVILATVAGMSLWRSRPKSRVALSLLAIGLAAKIAFDAVGASVTLAELPDQVRVAWQGHLLGGMLGGVCYFVIGRAQAERVTDHCGVWVSRVDPPKYLPAICDEIKLSPLDLV